MSLVNQGASTHGIQPLQVPLCNDELASQLNLHANQGTGPAEESLNHILFAHATRHQAPPMTPVRRAEESLPFTVQVVTTHQELQEVQALRSQAYGHHLPHLAESFGLPDPIDREAGTTVFCARDKATGRVVGSARVQSNRHAPLQIERSVQLPQALQGQSLAEITRLTVLPGYSQPVRLALVKTSYLLCVAIQVAGLLAGSRHSLVRQYESLGFSDLFGDNRMVPLVHAGGIEHRILFLNLVTAESDWRLARRPAHSYIFKTVHPDITIFESIESRLSRSPAL